MTIQIGSSSGKPILSVIHCRVMGKDALMKHLAFACAPVTGGFTVLSVTCELPPNQHFNDTSEPDFSKRLSVDLNHAYDDLTIKQPVIDFCKNIHLGLDQYVYAYIKVESELNQILQTPVDIILHME